MQVRDLVDDSLMVRQGKTRKRIRIMLTDETGARTELGLLIDRIKRRQIASLYLAATSDGRRMTAGMLHWQDVEAERRFCRTQGKTPAARREVPLSAEALRILAQLEAVREGESVFQLHGASLDALFRKARDKALIEDLHFHDFRHEGITRLSKRLPILALARAVGHRDLRMLQIYYNESGEDLAKMLD